MPAAKDFSGEPAEVDGDRELKELPKGVYDKP